MPGLSIRFPMACVVTILVETAVLWILLSGRHTMVAKIFAGAWLSLCTLPLVWMVLPAVPSLAAAPTAYMVVAELTAPLLECGLFWRAFIRHLPPEPRANVRDCLAIVAANLASFAVGEGIWLLMGIA